MKDIYIYGDNEGRPLGKVKRVETDGGKSFRQYHFDPASPRADLKGFVAGLREVEGRKTPLPIYRWDSLVQALERDSSSTVFIVEGEKCVKSAERLKLHATTNAGGAGKWRQIHTEQLLSTGVKRVVILPDNDDPGREHAQSVAKSIHTALWLRRSWA